MTQVPNSMWGQGFGPAAGLPPGAEAYINPVASAIFSPLTFRTAYYLETRHLCTRARHQ